VDVATPTDAGSGDPADGVLLLAPVLAAAATGDVRLAGCLDAAIREGVPLTAVREALLLVAPFAGFPRALDALAALAAAIERAGLESTAHAEPGLPADLAARAALFRQRGRELFDRVYGEASERVLARLLRLDPEVPGWVLQDAYGRVLSRPGLTAAARERLAVVLLASLGLRNQLRGHALGALACGATRREVRATLAAAGDLIPPELAAEALPEDLPD